MPIGDFDLGPFASRYKDADIMSMAAAVPTSASQARALVAQQGIENATLLAEQVGIRVANAVGLPAGATAAIGALVDMITRIAQGEEIAPIDAVKIMLQVANFAVPAALAAIEVVMKGTIAQVPILGWVVQVAMLLVDIAKIIYRATRKSDVADYNALGFSSGTDGDRATEVAQALDEDDWTRIWLPRHDDWKLVTLHFDGVYKADGTSLDQGANGYAWGPGIFDEKATGKLGVIPGGVNEQSGFGSYYQSPRRMIGSSRTAGPLDVTALENLLPSATQAAGMAWALMQQPNGRCCAIRLNHIANTWGEWQERANHFWLHAGDKLSSNESVWLRSQVGYSIGKGGPNPRWSTASKAVSVNLAIAKMRTRVRRLLATIACAYVPPGAPALVDDPALAALHAEMRMLLLTSPLGHVRMARYDLDLSLVDGGDLGSPYRAALVQKRLAAKTDTLAAPDVVARRRRGSRLPPLDGGAEPERPELPRVRPGGGGGGEEIIAAAILLGLLLL